MNTAGLSRSLRSQVGEPAVHAIALQLAGAVAAFLVYLAVARGVGTDASGQYALFVQTVVAGSAVSLFGYDQKVMRAVAHHLATGDAPRAWTNVWYFARRFSIAGLGVVALLLVLRPALDRIGFQSASLWLVGPTMLAYGSLRFATSALRGAKAIRLSQGLVTAPALIMLLLLAAWLLRSSESARSETTPIVLYALSISLPLCLAVAILRKTILPWRTAGHAARALDAETDSHALGLSVLVPTIATWASFAGLSYVFDSTEVAAYQVCVLLTTPFNMIRTTYLTAIAPELTDALAQRNTAQVRSLQRAHRRFLLGIGALPLVVLFVVADRVMGLFGPELTQDGAALRVFTLGMLVNLCFGSAATGLVMDGHDHRFLMITLQALAIWSMVLVLTIPALGVLGVAIGYAVQILYTQSAAALTMRRISSAAAGGS